MAGESLWLAGLLLATVAAVTEPDCPRTTIGIASTASFALMGLGAAALMVYWIQAIRTAAPGYRNREHFKAVIHFHCGGLDLYPVPIQFPDEP